MTLRALEDVLLELVGLVPSAAGSVEDGAIVHVTRMVVDVPMESRFAHGCRLEASWPRGVTATGFDPPLGRIRASFERSDS